MKFLDLKGVSTLVSYMNGTFFESVVYDSNARKIKFYSKSDKSNPLGVIDIEDFIKEGTTAY